MKRDLCISPAVSCFLDQLHWDLDLGLKTANVTFTSPLNMIRLRYIEHTADLKMSEMIPIFGMLTGIIIPLAAFFWQYIEGKERRATILEISKTIDDPDKLDELMSMLDEKKSEPTDYRRGGVVTLFVGAGIYALGAFAMGNLFEGAGMLVGLIGLGMIVAGYLYPPTSDELNQAVEEFEKR